MEKNYPYKDEGKRFTEMIQNKGYSIYRFALYTRYSLSRMYRLCSGECDLKTLQVTSATAFAKALGFKHIDDMYKALDIDVLNSLI